MEMCYGGALAMPSNYAVMNEEEMMYTAGGVKTYRYTTASEAEYSLKVNAAFYGAVAIGAGVGGAVTSVTGLGVAAFLAAGGAGTISAQMYSAWRSARNIKKKYGGKRRVKIQEELTFYPLGYSCTCKKLN